jgi:hypothetical protein
MNTSADRTQDAHQAGFASLALGWPLSLGLGLVALIQLGLWLPHYLTWPYWADHDVFASAARAWDLGAKPYRDVRQNNFPGTIYLFYLLGKTLGWGRPWTFYAFDSALLLALASLLIAWSRKVFGRILPGLIGSLAFLSYYLSLDYCHTAQRDWQGPALAVMALLIAQTWPGRAGRVVSALLTAAAFSIRPQVVLFLPALLLEASTGGQRGQALRRGVLWLGTFAAFAALAFVPLLLNGIFGDFLQSLRRVAFGSTYNKVGLASVAKGWLLQASAFRWLVVPAGIVLLSHRTEHAKTARIWLLALAGASFYKPLSPMAHSYLDLPLVLAWSVNLAVLAGLIVATSNVPSTIKLACVLALLGMGTTTLRPEFCVVGPNLRAWSTLRSGVESEDAPPGYRHGSVATSAFYPWSDYRAALLYLRTETKSSTKVANALKGDPAIASEVDRLSAFPAESIAWLRMVDPRDEPAFVESLESSTDSVVLWSPGEPGPDPKFQIPQIEAAIRRLYQFEARFGAIEVWRRRGMAGSDPSAM